MTSTVAAVANGGTYLRCPATMVKGEACTRTDLLAPGQSLAPVLSGMGNCWRLPSTLRNEA